jgi:hypothetical protein
MATPKRVLIVGLEPELIDFSDPAYLAFPGLDAAKIRAALERDRATLNGLGYQAEICLVDFGDTAEAVLAQRLDAAPWDCVLVGAGVRAIPANLLLFERLVNVIHRRAPREAAICFNTRPEDTADAVRRWV